jgi:hypothetical protein
MDDLKVGQRGLTDLSQGERPIALGLERRACTDLPAMFADGHRFDAPNSGSYNPL